MMNHKCAWQMCLATQEESDNDRVFNSVSVVYASRGRKMDIFRDYFLELVPGLVLGRGPGTKSFREVSDYRGFIFIGPCPV